MSITYYQSNRILDKDFGNVNYTVASTIYFGLSTTTISNDGTGATEPSGGSYARVALVNDKTNWGTAASGSLTNTTVVQFAESTASWGTITYVFISDALVSGNMMYFGALSPSRTVQINTVVYFAASSITVSIVNS